MSHSNITLQQIRNRLDATITLTGSKSESNRALILEKISGGKVQVGNLSTANDTVVLQKVLNSSDRHLDIGPAGTAMRFATAYFAIKNDGIARTLTGSERMQQRPIGILVDALRALGAEVEYEKNEGYPPLKFSGNFQQTTKQISIKGDVSSQFISALLLVAPALPLGLELEIIGALASRPYVEMTLATLAEVGIQHTWDENMITIQNQVFNDGNLVVEPDWSGASYWYSFVALSQEADLYLPNFKQDSKQGDSVIANIMQCFGVKSTFDEKGVRIEKTTQLNIPKTIDFADCPDLAQTVIVCCAALKQNCTFTGLKTLKIKETDRVKALQEQLAKIGAVLHDKGEGVCELEAYNVSFPENLFINTYEDHRMAMAFAPLLLKVPEIEFEDKDVVAKSYPHFWEDVERLRKG